MQIRSIRLNIDGMTTIMCPNSAKILDVGIDPSGHPVVWIFDDDTQIDKWPVHIVSYLDGPTPIMHSDDYLGYTNYRGYTYHWFQWR